VSLSVAPIDADPATPARRSLTLATVLAGLDAAAEALDRTADGLGAPAMAPGWRPPTPELWSAGLWGSCA
jgi:hypothetical protein